METQQKIFGAQTAAFSRYAAVALVEGPSKDTSAGLGSALDAWRQKSTASCI